MASVLNSLRKKLSRASFAGGSSAAAAAAAAASAAAAEEMEPVSAAGRARKASVVREREAHTFASLPQLRDTPASKREDIFRKKLQLCSILFDFSDSSIEAQGKELKRQTLLELVDFVNSSMGQKVFTEAVMPDVMHMIRSNIVRALPKMREDFDPEEDEPALEPSWPHMQVVYEFLLRFVVSSEVKAKVAKRYLDHNFCMHLVDLFDSEDPRERDYLKTILHRVYGKFMPHRAFIRRYIGYVFYGFIFERPQHNGVAELLEILGSIINGFALPLKPEHVTFLTKALIPLHRPAAMHMYHQQLAYCITQYVEKDPGIASTVIGGLCKIWPWQNSGKQVLMLSELEELLEFLSGDVLEGCMDLLCRTLGRCVGSEHFQVAERALFLWQNDQLLSRGVLAADYAPRLLPRILPPLLQHAQGHWNPTVEGLAEHVLSTYQTADAGLYEECLAQVETAEEAKVEAEAASKANWAAVAASVETEEYDDVYYG